MSTREALKAIIPLGLKRLLRLTAISIKGRVGALPDFLIIGTQRAGTTSLYEYLIQHPHILPAYKKELHFFNKNYRRGMNWYRSQFPSVFEKSQLKRKTEANCLTGEATPCYFIHPLAPARIQQDLPEVKMIIMLRNPVDRAYSQYKYNLKKGREPLGFEAAIEQEAERLAGEEEKLIAEGNYYSFNHQHYSYLLRGRYIEILPRWLDRFGGEGFLILKSEDFFQNPAAIYHQTLEFLGLNPYNLEKYKIINYTADSPMSADMQKKLGAYFADYNHRLYEYLGRDFGW